MTLEDSQYSEWVIWTTVLMLCLFAIFGSYLSQSSICHNYACVAQTNEERDAGRTDTE